MLDVDTRQNILQLAKSRLFTVRVGYEHDSEKKIMSEASNSEYHKFSIPLTVDINSGNNWGEAH